MPRQKVYGKRSRPIYDIKAANLSSPEQQQQQSENTAKANEGKKRTQKKERKALEERDNNAVVLPAELIQYAAENKTPKRKTRVRRRDRIVLEDDEENESELVRHSPRKKSTPPSKLSSPQEDTTLEHEVEIASVEEHDRHESIKPTTEMPFRHAGHSSQERPEMATSDSFDQHCLPLLRLTAHPIGSFSTWSSQLSSHFAINKIAEASFGEVYRLSLLEEISSISRSDESVFKIIPLRAPSSTLPKDKRKLKAAMTKQEMMSKPGDVANEVKLLQRMSAIPGFTNFRDMRVLQGRPPEAFVEAFKSWNDEQKGKKKELSHFPDPSKKSSYSEDQLWAVIEMQDAGNDLERLVENGECTSIWKVWDIFWQVVLSLAKGEEGAEFEHRDLHLGNICVRSPLAEPIDAINTKRKLGFTSLETTIIDYTISRCLMPAPHPHTAFTDLSLDTGLFEGDSTDEYQYDIYRYMRGILYLDDAYAEIHGLALSDLGATGRTWEQYHPATNLVWLHLVLYKLLEQVEWPSAKKAPPKKTRREEWKEWRRANDLEHVLLKVQELLDPGAICGNDIWAAGDLVLLALCEGWLDAQDVTGHGEGDESALVSQLEGLALK